MTRGFYILGSGLLTQSRVLSTISSNMANAETTGYKAQKMATTTFGSMVMANLDSKNIALGTVSLMNTVDELQIDHSQGSLAQTGRNLDFAIQGEGLFAVQGKNGTVYTRNGNFNLDDEGYLVLNGVGRVLGADGEPIMLATDDFTADSSGNLMVNGETAGKIGIYTLADYNTLQADGQGCYTSAGEQLTLMDSPTVLSQTLEGSNVDETKEMTAAISSERNLQSCSQAIQMYYETMDKAVSEIAKV